MKLVLTLIAFLTVSCGVPVTNSKVKQQDDSKTPTGIENDEEIVITFVGMRRGYLKDNSLLSFANTNLDVYMHVGAGMTPGTFGYKKFGNTRELSIPSDSKRSEQIKSGEQIIISGLELNDIIANNRDIQYLKVQFYENGLFFDDAFDRLDDKSFDLRNIERLLEVSKSPERKKTFYLEMTDSKAEIEFSVEFRKMKLEK